MNSQTFPAQNFPKSRRSSFVFYLFLFLVFSPCFFLVNAQAGEVTLAWDPPSTEYEGFILSYGTTSAYKGGDFDVGTNTTHTLSNLRPGYTYFFAVKAYKANRTIESSYSNQVSVTMPVQDTTAPAPPKSVQVVSGG